MIEQIKLYDGKYTIQLVDNGISFKVLRYGEEWRDLAGDGLFLAMFQEIQDLKEKLEAANEWKQE
jgi:hypothetical protein